MKRAVARLVTASAIAAVAIVPAAPAANAAECGDLALVCAVVCKVADKYTTGPGCY